MTRPVWRLQAVSALAIWYALLAGFAWMAPYSWREQHREYASAPPTTIRLVDPTGVWRMPFVCSLAPAPDSPGSYREDCAVRHDVWLFGRAQDGRMVILCPEQPGVLFLFGTDELGRDIFSRSLAGGLVTFATGLVATLVALFLALLGGSLAGLLGGWPDLLISRGTELLMALPALYLLLALRAALPIQTPPLLAFALAVGLISLLGWARPARLLRGVVMSTRGEGYVMAARGFGAGPLYLLRKHILPRLRGVLGAQAAVLLPQFMLVEVALSFLGLGVAEPLPSWGTMLSSIQYDLVADRRWWLGFPAILLTASILISGRVARAMELGSQPAGGAPRETTP